MSLHPTDSFRVSLIQMAGAAGQHASEARERLPSVILYHTRLLARLFARLSEALPCHLSNTHGRAQADIYTCFPAECQHLSFIDTETHAYLQRLE